MVARSHRNAGRVVLLIAALAGFSTTAGDAAARPHRHAGFRVVVRRSAAGSTGSAHHSTRRSRHHSKHRGSGGGSTGGSGAPTPPSGGSTGGSGGSTGGSTGGSGGSAGGSGAPTPPPGGGGSEPTGAGLWVPPRHLTWYWQLQGTVNNSQPVAAYDIDGFDNTAAEVSTLHAQGKHVICYIDAGTYEPGRPDSSRFPPSSMGAAVEGWPGERWLDIRQLSTLEPIISARLAMCREKGFDAVEPDNMDGYSNNTGFPLTAQQQLTFNEWVAGEVHSLGLAVFQKNDGEQTGQLQSHFDGAINEQCNQYSECSSFQPYLAAGKPVLNAEYGLSTSSFCGADNAAGIMGARYSLALNGSTFEPCW
jgi:Glycoside-hydrolase family GH114